MINSCVFSGRLVKDVELKTLDKGTTVGKFTIAVNRNADKTDFIPCVAFNKSAELLGQYTKKGSLIGVEGCLQNNNYQKEDGTTVYNMNILVTKFSFLEKKQDNENSFSDNQNNSESAWDVGTQDDLPF